jgi:DNA mismatch repair protein MutS
VVLDEVGRGTSTYDGHAIAWAVAEHLADAIGCRSLFATHYHELCELAQTRPSVVNFNVAARQHEDRVIFLHKLVPGGANRSYGIAVAQLAGVPEIVLARARTLLASLESGSGGTARSSGASAQLEIFPATPEPRRESELEATLRALELDRMTPLDALLALHRLKQLKS